MIPRLRNLPHLHVSNKNTSSHLKSDLLLLNHAFTDKVIRFDHPSQTISGPQTDWEKSLYHLVSSCLAPQTCGPHSKHVAVPDPTCSWRLKQPPKSPLDSWYSTSFNLAATRYPLLIKLIRHAMSRNRKPMSYSTKVAGVQASPLTDSFFEPCPRKKEERLRSGEWMSERIDVDASQPKNWNDDASW
jgi:hypothetical protein